MLKNSLRFKKKIQTSRVNNSRILRIKNAKLSDVKECKISGCWAPFLDGNWITDTANTISIQSFSTKTMFEMFV